MTSAAKTETKIGVHVVGPAAGFDDAAKDTDEYRGWASVREAAVTLAKRMGLGKVDQPLAAPTASEDVEEECDGDRRYTRSGLVGDTIEPPFPFEILCALGENSSALTQNIEAMAMNVDGFGHSFEPVLNFSGPEINNQVRDLMIQERLEGVSGASSDLMLLTKEQLDEITPGIEEIEEQRQLWERIATIEKGRVESFFEFVNPLKPFTEVRVTTRRSKELMGNAGWEVIRENPGDVTSRITQVYNVPFLHVRLCRSDEKPTSVKMKIRKDRIRFEEIPVERYFRRFLRRVGSLHAYYKEFGDPRTVSRKTGKYYDSVDELREAETKDAVPANEFFHWEIESESSVYGVPRWIGALISVLGSRAAEEVNFLYFDNKAIPPMVLLVSGGRVSQDSVSRLESYIEERIKGRQNYHKILVLEAIPADVDVSEGDLEHSGKMRIELKPLLGEQIQDALFQEYDTNNILKIGRSFRQPQLLTGDTRDMNRATAEVAKAFAEEQIYQPARTSFDQAIDRHFMVNLGIHFWRFVSRAPVQRIPNDLVDNVKKALEAGGIVPNEARKLLSDAFSIDLEHRSEDWANVPPRLAQASAREGGMPSAEPTRGDHRAADQVDVAADGEQIARGRTSDGPGHEHVFVALREGSGVRVFVLPAEDHSHVVEPVKAGEGEVVEVRTTASGEGEAEHSHEVAFSVPLSKRRKRAQSLAIALHHLRRSIEEEVEAAKDEFFDPVRLAHE